MLTGYLHGTGDSETKMRVGDRVWHRTGDAGYLDDRGRLLMGRCSARIDDAHGTLYPFAVEAAAQAVDGIARAALIARDGARLLAIEFEPKTPAPALLPPQTQDQMRAALRRTLAGRCWPTWSPFARFPSIAATMQRLTDIALRKLLDR